MSKKIASPEEFFGFRMGTDRKMARWNEIVDYFNLLNDKSDRIEVIELGETTEDNPFLLTIISSPENLDRIEELREINLKISDPRGLSSEEVEELIGEGKAVVCQTMSMHATEIGGTQMAPELAYEMLTDNDEEVQRILENVIFLMVPCFNPDGQLMVTDWYEETLDTDYEGIRLPWLYQKYAGHDNNRDGFMLNLAESQHVGRILYTHWKPQAYQDHHHMGSYGARFYVAPYCNPIHPDADPLIWREHAWFGGHMAYKLEQEGKEGVLNAAQYPGWGHLGFHWITAYHNIAGMLTESASASLASPLYIDPDQLQGASPRTMPEYEAQTNFPNPWEGGWWGLRDIVEQQKIASIALLDICARYRETVLRNACNKARRQTERGKQGDKVAFVIEPQQHDPLVTEELVEILLDQGIEIKTAQEEFEADGKHYPSGTRLVFLQQPKRGLIETLLGQTKYPDNYWTRTPDGSPTVFDTATDTVAEFMGVEVNPIHSISEGSFSVMNNLEKKQGQVAAAAAGYLIDPRLNRAHTAVNRLLSEDIEVLRLHQSFPVEEGQLPAGAFFVPSDAACQERLTELAAELGLDFLNCQTRPDDSVVSTVKQPRVGIYQRYWGGNADEGWTRFIFDTNDFPYETITDEDILNGSLADSFDVIILPHDTKGMIVDITSASGDSRMARYMKWRVDDVPEKYQSGIGSEGVESLGQFVREGGRLVGFDGACEVVVDAAGLKIENAVKGLDSKDYLTHGSTIRAHVDIDDRLGYGMPRESLIFSWDSAAFTIHEALRTDQYRVIVRYADENLLQSGRLVGEDKIESKPAMIAAEVGKGEAVLIGFRPQHRAQTHGTYKLLFNCLYS